MRSWFFLPIMAVLLIGCPGNSEPVIQTLNLSSFTLNACDVLTLNASASDADNDSLTYDFEVNPTGTGVFGQDGGSSATWAINPSRTVATTVTFTLSVSDKSHTVTKDSATVTVAAGASTGCGSISGTVRPAVQFFAKTEFIPGQALVSFKPNTTLREKHQVLYGNTSLLENPDFTRSRSTSRSVFGNDAAGVQTLEWIEELKTRSDVETAEPNYIAHAFGVPNDALLAGQWDVAQMNSQNAWNAFGSNSDIGKGVTIAIIDSGILYRAGNYVFQHPDFDCEVSPGVSKVAPGIDTVFKDTDPFDDTADSEFHGSHVAGTAAACTNNAKGIAGVAWNARILPIRALSSGTGSFSDIIAGLLWAVGEHVAGFTDNPNPANVVNMSLGGNNPPSALMQAAIDKANARGAVVVIAAGNGDSTGKPVDVSQFSPANQHGVIVVGASGATLAKAGYSNIGPGVSLIAPGGDQSKLGKAEDGILSLQGCGASGFDPGTAAPCSPSKVLGYGNLQGTSMAAPHVAGVVALMMSRRADLLTPSPANKANNWARILSYLQAASSLTGLTGCEAGCGAGLLDAQKAVQNAFAFGVTGALFSQIADTTSNSKLGAIQLGSDGLNANFALENLGDSSATATLSVTGTGLSLPANPNLSIAPNAKQVFSVALNRTGLVNGTYAGRINIAYAGKMLEIRVYYDQGIAVIADTSNYFVRLYQKYTNANGASDPNCVANGSTFSCRKRLNFPDTALAAGGTFNFGNLEPGLYDLSSYHRVSGAVNQPVVIDQAGDLRGLNLSAASFQNQIISLRASNRTICSREGDGTNPTSCP